MPVIQLEAIPHHTRHGTAYQHLHFQLTTNDGIIAPDDLKGLKLPNSLNFTHGIVIEGRGPIWLYGCLVHECHPATWVGCYDPRLGAVVVVSHTPSVSVGQVFPLDLPQRLKTST